MPQALIVAGYEPWQFKSSKRIARFLRTRTRIRYAPVFDGLGSTEANLLARLKRAMAEGSPEDLLLVWLNTHGSHGGWLFLDRDEKTHMNAVAAMLAQGKRKTLLVVNSCHSGLMAEALKEMGADPDRIGCIMACQEDRVCYNDDLIDAVLDTWQRHQAYLAETLMFCGCIRRLPPIGAIRVGNPVFRLYDTCKYWWARLQFEIAEYVYPSGDHSICSQRWGARLDPWLWRKRRRA